MFRTLLSFLKDNSAQYFIETYCKLKGCCMYFVGLLDLASVVYLICEIICICIKLYLAQILGLLKYTCKFFLMYTVMCHISDSQIKIETKATDYNSCLSFMMFRLCS